MATSNSTPSLHTMPPEILLIIMNFTSTFSCKVSLARTCSAFYNTLIEEVYKQASSCESLAQEHIYEACRDGNILTLERTFQADASYTNDSTYDLLYSPPLYAAITHYQVDAVQWLLEHGANPNIVATDEHNAWVVRSDSPLQLATSSVLWPGIPDWRVPEKWHKQGFVVPTLEECQSAGRAMIKLLRDAGADENSLFEEIDREHLDSIQNNVYCCDEHVPEGASPQ